MRVNPKIKLRKRRTAQSDDCAGPQTAQSHVVLARTSPRGLVVVLDLIINLVQSDPHPPEGVKHDLCRTEWVVMMIPVHI